MDIHKKKQITEDLQGRFEKSTIVILTDYKGLDVAAMNDLRRKLRGANTEYQVVKNSLLVRASEGNDVALIKDRFKGPSAVALSNDDPVAPAKVLSDFIKENKKFEIKVGVLNGKIIDPDGIKALSSLPSREVLLAQVLSTMNAVPSSLVRALADVPRRFVNVLQAIKEQKEAEA
ncbi:50S ribosomal protein L10 [uncultured Desulfosarcina sp.]|uniref:50S ribosomal protein L10 n=1 Tax=uncultured Desulfosarcina sp. TaxID=218289 RepID=UPI0029C66038|nr:50S ribosomal protein L10 [uncultured Desulfosarcina sp.]